MRIDGGSQFKHTAARGNFLRSVWLWRIIRCQVGKFCWPRTISLGCDCSGSARVRPSFIIQFKLQEPRLIQNQLVHFWPGRGSSHSDLSVIAEEFVDSRHSIKLFAHRLIPTRNVGTQFDWEKQNCDTKQHCLIQPDNQPQSGRNQHAKC